MPTLSIWQSGLRGPALECDVAVVGAGIVGTSTAFWLGRQAPGTHVALLDAERPAAGASGRNAGFVLQGAGSDYALDVERYGRETAQRLWRFTRENRDQILVEGGAAAGFEATGSLVVAGSSGEDARLRHAFDLMREDGLPAAYLTPRAVAERTGTTGLGGGLFVTTGGVVDPARLVGHLAARSGADLRPGCAAIAVEPLADGRVRVVTTAGDVIARRVVIALNAYAPRVVPELGAYVRPVRAQMLATAAMLPRRLAIPVYSHDGYYYVRQRPDGQIVLGGARHRHVDAEIGYEDATTDALQRDLEAYLARHIPAARGVEVVHRWSGTMGFSPDGLPVVTPLSGIPAALSAVGFTGHGMAYGMNLGRHLAAWALGRDATALPPAVAVFARTRPTLATS